MSPILLSLLFDPLRLVDLIHLSLLVVQQALALLYFLVDLLHLVLLPGLVDLFDLYLLVHLSDLETPNQVPPSDLEHRLHLIFLSALVDLVDLNLLCLLFDLVPLSDQYDQVDLVLLLLQTDQLALEGHLHLAYLLGLVNHLFLVSHHSLQYEKYCLI